MQETAIFLLRIASCRAKEVYAKSPGSITRILPLNFSMPIQCAYSGLT